MARFKEEEVEEEEDHFSEDLSSCPGISKWIQKQGTIFQIYLRGFFGLCLLGTFVVLSLPVYLFRHVLRSLAPRFGYGEPVSALGNLFATEFLTNFPPRCAIVSNFVVEGSIEPEEVRTLLRQRWIDAISPEGKGLLYPELRQSIEYWMGFMWWKDDAEFNLDNHLHFHRIPVQVEGALEEDAASERSLCTLMEHLLNKPFPRGRSPWEVHIVNNYKNSKLDVDGNNNRRVTPRAPWTPQKTCVILRFHHGLADGFSLLYAVIEGLFQQSVTDMALPKPQPTNPPQASSVVHRAAQLLFDLGIFGEKILKDEQTPWHVPNNRKTWHQLYGRSELIPLARLKEIKNRFGVSLTATILSCLAAGVQRSLESHGHPNCKSMMAGSPVPLPGHPKRFRNHVTAAIFELPTDSALSSVQRLRESERKLEAAKKSTSPGFGVLYSTLVGSHFAPVARRLMTNHMVPMGLSNFPGPGKEIEWEGRRGLAADFVAGAVNGVAGVAFMVLSYRDHIRISVSAEKAVMGDSAEVNRLMGFVTQEIDNLHHLATAE